MQQTTVAPVIAKYLASVLIYCPTEGVFYSSSVYAGGEAKGELNGTLVYGIRKPIIEKGSGKLMIRAGNRFGRRSVSAAKLAYFLVHGEWPYFVGHKYGQKDLRVQGLKALMSPGEYMETLGDMTYWQRAFAAMPDLPEQKECQVQWFPGLAPGVEEV